MRSIQTSVVFPLSSVKPLEGLQRYRDFCLAATRTALGSERVSRPRCPACDDAAAPAGTVEGLTYARCRGCESLFLDAVARPAAWAELVRRVTQYRHSPDTFHAGIAQSRRDNVFAPKLDWIRSTLLLQDVTRPHLIEIGTAPSDVEALLRESGLFASVVALDEMTTMAEPARGGDDRAGVAVMLESLDRVSDPLALLRAVGRRLAGGGLLFVTALVASGFDVAVLGLDNLYLYPPDRANCFSRRGLEQMLERAGFALLEVSTPGVLDVEVVKAHVRHGVALALGAFERQLLAGDEETRNAFQSFLQQQGLSSFARIVARKYR
jgi:hypothetical protein